VQHVLLSGPTYFSEIIETAASIASQPYTADLQVRLDMPLVGYDANYRAALFNPAHFDRRRHQRL